MPVREAALQGLGEIGFTIMSMTLSLVAVFIPVLFMGGILGRLLHEFAVTITAAILVSGLVSLTLTPMLCSRFLHPHRAAAATRLHGGSTSWSERVFHAMLVGLYERTLRFCLRHRGWSTVRRGRAHGRADRGLARMLPQGFIPTDDTGIVRSSPRRRRTSPSTRWCATSRRRRRSSPRIRRSTRSCRRSAGGGQLDAQQGPPDSCG
jgi:HAE1 family hydrophobic/amphiphilic exporter-1